MALDLSVLTNVPAALAGLAARGVAAHPVKEDPVTEKTEKAGADPAKADPATPVANAAPDTAKIAADARAEGEQAAMARVTEIMDLCALAGAADKAAGLIASGKSVADIRKELVTARATAGDGIDNRQPTSGANGAAAVNWADAYKPHRAQNARNLSNRM